MHQDTLYGQPGYDKLYKLLDLVCVPFDNKYIIHQEYTRRDDRVGEDYCCS